MSQATEPQVSKKALPDTDSKSLETMKKPTQIEADPTAEFEAEASTINDEVAQDPPSSTEPTDHIYLITKDERVLCFVHKLRQERNDAKVESLHKCLKLQRVEKEKEELNSRIVALLIGNAGAVGAIMQIELMRKTYQNEKLTQKLEAKSNKCEELEGKINQLEEVGIGMVAGGEINRRMIEKLNALLEVAEELRTQLADEKRRNSDAEEPLLCSCCNLLNGPDHAKLKMEASRDNLAQSEDVMQQLARGEQLVVEMEMKIEELRNRLDEMEGASQELVEQPPNKKRSIDGELKNAGGSSSRTEPPLPHWETDFPLPNKGDFEMIAKCISKSTKRCQLLESTATIETEEVLLKRRQDAEEKVMRKHQAFEKAQLELSGVDKELQQVNVNRVLIDKHVQYLDDLMELMS